MLEAGEAARLMPVVADTSREVRATSILLATMTVVPALARTLLSSLGQSVGARAVLHGFTEVAFRYNKDDKASCRPDGLILLNSGRGRSWSCLIESKIARSQLDPDQIARYAALAKANGIDAILTLSNQFATLPTHSPVKLKKAMPKSVALFHWSWMNVITEAMLLLAENEVQQPEQRYVLAEMVRYFSHDSIGVSMFDRMNPEWKELVGSVQAGAAIGKSSDTVQNSVAAWHQETRDLALLMTRNLNRPVRLRLGRAHKGDPGLRLKDDCDQLVAEHCLVCTLDIPDAAAPLVITADVRRRTIAVSMTVAAPADRQRASSRINWLVRQLSKSDPIDVHVRASWPGRAPMTQALLAALRVDPLALESNGRAHSPTQFEVALVRDLGAKFAGTKTFIEQLEDAADHFYDHVGQHLRAYVPSPPRVKRPEVLEGTSSDSSEARDRQVESAESASYEAAVASVSSASSE